MMKPPPFSSQQEADDWMHRRELMAEFATGRRRIFLTEFPDGEGIIVGYNTTSTETGKFIVITYRSDGYGGVADVLYIRRVAKCKLARELMLKQYAKYSPKWRERRDRRRERAASAKSAD